MTISLADLQDLYNGLQPIANRHRFDGTATELDMSSIPEMLDIFLSEADVNDGGLPDSLRQKLFNHHITNFETLRAFYAAAIDLDRTDGVLNGQIQSSLTDFEIALPVSELPIDLSTRLAPYHSSIFEIIKSTNGHGNYAGTYWIVDREALPNGQWRYWGLTNAHVVDDVNQQELFYKARNEVDGIIEEIPLHLQSADHATDVAVLWFDSARELTPLVIDENPDVEIGDQIVIIGNQRTGGVIDLPGTVNAVKKYVGWAMPQFQDDSLALGGNSGSPVVSAATQKVIGMCNSGTENGENYNIYSDRVLASYREIRARGYVEHGSLNTYNFQFLDSNALVAQGLQGYSNAQFLIFTPHWGALYKAGLRSGDIILAYDGHPMPDLSNQSEFRAYVAERTRKFITLTVFRDGRIKSFHVKVGTEVRGVYPTFTTANGYLLKEVDRQYMRTMYGLDQEPLGPAMVKYRREKDKIKYTPVGFIYEMNGIKVRTIEDYQSAARSAQSASLIVKYYSYLNGRWVKNIQTDYNELYQIPTDSD